MLLIGIFLNFDATIENPDSEPQNIASEFTNT